MEFGSNSIKFSNGENHAVLVAVKVFTLSSMNSCHEVPCFKSASSALSRIYFHSKGGESLHFLDVPPKSGESLHFLNVPPDGESRATVSELSLPI